MGKNSYCNVENTVKMIQSLYYWYVLFELDLPVDCNVTRFCQLPIHANVNATIIDQLSRINLTISEWKDKDSQLFS